MRSLRILALEPYYGGSHRAVLDGLASRVDAEWTTLTLPARKWKWRMRGAAITMAAEARQLLAYHGCEDRWDVVFASTFVNLAEFRGLAGPEIAAIPAVVIFHENQLVYPNRHTAEWDFQFPLTNITSALSAERCIFNTAWNRDSFLGEIDSFLAGFPDHQPKGVAEIIATKSSVVHVPFDPACFDAAPVVRGSRARIVWPHRWEHDKNPEEFFEAVNILAEEGLDFEVAVAGQQFRDRPDVFERAEALLGDRLIHLGEPKDRDAYAALLASSDVAVSTATNEFFGLAMIEASYAGAFPLVPDRLAYPELYPGHMRYSDGMLADALRRLVVDRPKPGQARQIAERFTFDRLVPQFESVLREVALGGSR